MYSSEKFYLFFFLSGPVGWSLLTKTCGERKLLSKMLLCCQRMLWFVACGASFGRKKCVERLALVLSSLCHR